MACVVRLATSAGTGEGRGHLARSLSLAEARWPKEVALELALARGEPTASERARAAAAGLRLVDPGTPLAPEGLVVLDVPEPAIQAAAVAPDRLAVFDDRETYTGGAAIVIQPSLPTWSGRARAARVLAGYSWAPVGAAWRSWIDHREAAPETTQRVVVCFGGSDPLDVTARIGPAIASDSRWSTSVGVGADYRGRAGAVVRLLRDPDDLPRLVATADVALIGAGTMKFEVAALGRPAILLAVADDQLPVGPPFAATGAARWSGDGRTLAPDEVRTAVADLLGDASARAAMTRAAQGQVDGGGADRLAAEIAAVALGDHASAS